MESYKTDYAVGKPYGSITVVNGGINHEHRIGTYTFRHGVVRIYAEPTFVSFDYVLNGRGHSLTLSKLPKPLTNRQLIVRAGKFVRELFESFD